MEISKDLRFIFTGNGISILEEGDSDFTAHISRTRKITINPDKQFARENLEKIYNMADSGNMRYSNDSTLGYLALSPIHKPTKEYINTLTDEVLPLSVETVDGVEYVCTRDGKILSDNPNLYHDIPQTNNPENKKYMLTNYTKEYDGHILYRIRALKNFAGIKAGELGGYVAGEHNLSQYGNSWIQQDSMVFNLAYVGDNALVSKSIMYGNAKAVENSRIIHTTMYGDTVIKGFAISNNAYIYYKSVICGESRVSGHLAFEGKIKDKVFIKDPGVKVTGNNIELSGEAQISDQVEIEGNAKVGGKSRIMGHAKITDYAEVSGSGVIIKDDVYIGGKSRIWDNVILAGEVKVNGRALIRENAEVYDNVIIGDAVEICGHPKIKDNVIVSGCSIVGGYSKLSGNAIITDYAQLYSHVLVRGNAQIRGNVRLTDFVCVTENAKIDGDVILSGETIVKGKSHISTQSEADKIIKPCLSKEISNENFL